MFLSFFLFLFFSAVTDTEQKKDATTETKVDAGSKKTTDSKVGKYPEKLKILA